MPHLTAAPASGSVSLEDLYRGMSRGLVVTQRPIVSMDQQLSSGALFPWVNAFEVVRGKIVGRVKNVGLQFRTLPLWKSLTALGDISTVCDTEYEVAKGARWQVALHTTSAPAGMFVGLNVVDVGGTGA
jgi:predicted Zn-dependent protease